MVTKPVKVDDINFNRRKILPMEVNEVRSGENYKVTDPDEEKQLLRALNEDNSIVPDDEILKMLRN